MAKTDPEWLKDWKRAAVIARKTITGLCNRVTALTEPGIAHALSQRLDNQMGLFLASSMPIRDMDAFGAFKNSLPVAANRGASGIDGTIASASGYVAGLNCPATLLIGDQAFLHDLNSLALVRQAEQPIVLVVVNNNGGRIFELLPITEKKKLLEPFFAAPHGLTFRKFAEAFGIRYTEVKNRRAFEEAYSGAVRGGRSTIIEAIVDPKSSREHRQRLLEAVKGELDTCRW